MSWKTDDGHYVTSRYTLPLAIASQERVADVVAVKNDGDAISHCVEVTLSEEENFMLYIDEVEGEEPFPEKLAWCLRDIARELCEISDSIEQRVF